MRHFGFAGLALVGMSALLLGCPNSASSVCDRLEGMRAADYAPPPRQPCIERLDKMRSKSAGEYGMCQECIMNSRDERARLAACRESCPGFEDALPAK
jgi:hypothetical protein